MLRNGEDGGDRCGTGGKTLHKYCRIDYSHNVLFRCLITLFLAVKLLIRKRLPIKDEKIGRSRVKIQVKLNSSGNAGCWPTLEERIGCYYSA